MPTWSNDIQDQIASEEQKRLNAIYFPINDAVIDSMAQIELLLRNYGDEDFFIGPDVESIHNNPIFSPFTEIVGGRLRITNLDQLCLLLIKIIDQLNTIIQKKLDKKISDDSGDQLVFGEDSES